MARRRYEQYEGADLIAWILDPMRLRAMFPWWQSFEQQQQDWKEAHRTLGRAAPYTGLKGLTVGGFGQHWFRIPARIDAIICKIDPDLDGRNEAKMEKFLKDYPIFDVRVRAGE